MFKLVIPIIMTTSIFAMPNEWDKQSACDKRDYLWQKIEETKHSTLPKMQKFGIAQIYKFSRQNLNPKVSLKSDVAPEGWIKYIHARGAVAKVNVISTGDHSYSGIFKGADCSLLRLSLTYRPKDGYIFDKAVAPGLALKVFRDNIHSANISALYTLQGQDQDYNFFTNPLSNIVPKGTGFGQKIVHKIFKKYTRYPERILINDLADFNTSGEKESRNVPDQIFFVPVKKSVSFIKSEAHDVRDDFLKIPRGTHLYDIYAYKGYGIKINYDEYKISDIEKVINKSEKIGKIVTESSFLASQFGDYSLFFKHETR